MVRGARRVGGGPLAARPRVDLRQVITGRGDVVAAAMDGRPSRQPHITSGGGGLVAEAATRAERAAGLGTGSDPAGPGAGPGGGTGEQGLASPRGQGLPLDGQDQRHCRTPVRR